MRISEFVLVHPDCAFDYDRQLRDQPRMYEGTQLDQYPVELEPEHAYQAGSRGRPNPNQTRAHSQCATCHRVLRNDFFYTVPSMMKRNVVFPHCRACNQQHNAARYETRGEVIRARREALWRYLAPKCAMCGFDQHFSALELHTANPGESRINELIASISLSVEVGHVEALLREAAQSVPLCSNCHRMLHANASKLPDAPPRTAYRLAELLARLKTVEYSTR